MSLVKIPLLVGTSGGTPVSSSPQRMYNYYPNRGPASKEGVVWKNTPGWTTYYSTGGTGIRGIKEFNGSLYFVQDRYLKKYDSIAGVESTLGTLSTTNGRVTMAEDGISLLISDNVKIYRINTSETFSTVTLPAALSPTGKIIQHEGHFITNELNTGIFWISDKFDGSTWNALQFATAEDKSDNITSIISDRVLWIAGTYTMQAYFNSGQKFPFLPNPQGRLIYGMEGVDTLAQLDNTTYWLARSEYGNLQVVRANGFVPQTVSTPEIDEELASLSKTSDAFAKSVMWEGHEWYVLTFPTARRTFVFDTKGTWFEWGNYDAGLGRFVEHPMLDYVYFNGLHLFTDADGNINQLKGDVYKHGTKVMSSVSISNMQHVDEQRVFLHSLIVDMRTGVGPLNTSSTMEVAVSYDGGYTYDNWQARGLGRDGSYRTRMEWHRLGSGFNLALKTRITDEVPREIIKGVVRVSVYESYLERRNQRAGLDNEQ